MKTHDHDLARESLNKLFAHNPVMLDHLSTLNATNLIVAEILLSQKTVSNLNYNVDADFEFCRCDAVIGTLKRQYSLPIRREMVKTTSSDGKVVKRARYYINDKDLKRLHTKPANILAENRQYTFIRQTISESKALSRLIVRYGKSGAVKRTIRHAFKNTDASKAGMTAATHQIDLLCEKLVDGVK